MQEWNLPQPGLPFSDCALFKKKKIKETGYSKCRKELDKACFQHNLSKINLKKRTYTDKILWENALKIAREQILDD